LKEDVWRNLRIFRICTKFDSGSPACLTLANLVGTFKITEQVASSSHRGDALDWVVGAQK
jgi:hypothetical protein